MKERVHCEVLTPLFSRGVYEDLAEIRAASIRGQLHWWFRALGGGIEQERAIFGGIARKDKGWKDKAGKVMVRVGRIEGQQEKCKTLPHKEGGYAAPKQAFLPGTTFDLLVADRLGGLDAKDQTAFLNSLQAWLLLGTLGLRGTRAAGSLAYTAESGLLPDAPQTINAYESSCASLLSGTKIRMKVLAETQRDAREVASDTIGGRDDKEMSNSLSRINYPLGSMKPRKTSPLHLRVYRFDVGDRLVAVWDGRHDRIENLLEAARWMTQKHPPKPLGQLLLDAFS